MIVSFQSILQVGLLLLTLAHELKCFFYYVFDGCRHKYTALNRRKHGTLQYVDPHPVIVTACREPPIIVVAAHVVTYIAK